MSLDKKIRGAIEEGREALVKPHILLIKSKSIFSGKKII